MEPSTWSRDDLTGLVRGKWLLMRSPTGADLPIPGWLVGASSGVRSSDSVESIEITHPDDRATLIESFVRSLSMPGELTAACRIRVHLEGRWEHDELTWLNLNDHPDVGGLLCMVVEVDGPPIAPVQLEGVGDSIAANWMILVLGDIGVVRSVRGRVEEILGYRPDDLIERHATDFLHPEAVAGATANWIELMQDPQRTRTSRRLWVRRDGREVWLESSYLVHDDGSVELVVVDIDDRVANERALAASQAEVAALAADFRLLADEVPAAVFRCDVGGRVQFHNARWTEVFGRGTETYVQDIVHPDDRASVASLLSSLVADAGSEPRSVEVRAEGGLKVLNIRCRAVIDEAADPRIVGSVTDITATVHLRHQALHDPLTGLRNRTAIEAHLEAALADDPEGTLVVFIDLDGFKVVNDACGHDVGDTVLQEVARRLELGVRPDDAIGRYGGDEFVVVCRRVADPVVDRVTGRIERSLGGPIELDGFSWQPSASVGVARPAPGDDLATVVRNADHAMYQAKQVRQRSVRA